MIRTTIPLANMRFCWGAIDCFISVTPCDATRKWAANYMVLLLTLVFQFIVSFVEPHFIIWSPK